MDFTIKKYSKLCRYISENNIKTKTVLDYLTSNIADSGKTIIIRHDVDRLPRNALKLASIENEFGIKSTYYFRKSTENIVTEIKDLGHEIGYHYEVLAMNKGDVSKAITEFQQYIVHFSKVCPIKTICMHGSPHLLGKILIYGNTTILMTMESLVKLFYPLISIGSFITQIQVDHGMEINLM